MSRQICNFKVELCERSEIKEFIETHHYSKSINGLMSNYCFKLLDGDELIGGMIYGYFGMANVWKAYGNKKEDVMELRRLATTDDTPKNTESFYIAKTLKWLKQNTELKTIISYSDLEYGHEGIIYQASNFKKLGQTQSGRVIINGDKRYHDKAIRTKYKGELKPFAKRLIQALEDGEAYYHKTKPKNIYEYKLRK